MAIPRPNWLEDDFNFSVQTTISGLTRAEIFLRTPYAYKAKKSRALTFYALASIPPLAVPEAQIDSEFNKKNKPSFAEINGKKRREMRSPSASFLALA